MLIMGVDLALNKIGITFYDTVVGHWYDVFLLSRKKGKSRRILELKNRELDGYIEIAQHIQNFVVDRKPDIVVAEDFSFGSIGRSVFDIGQMTGIVRLYLSIEGYSEKNKNFVLFSPSAVKKAACGKGNASKIEVMMAVCKKTKEDYVEQFGAEAEDVCDSVGVVMAYLQGLVKTGLKLENDGSKK